MPKRKQAISYEVNDKLLARVESLALTGLTLEQIAHCLDWSIETLYKKKRLSAELAEAIKKGQDKGVATVTNALFQNARNGNLGAQIFYLKNRAGWRDKSEHEHTGKDGGPIRSEVIEWVLEPVSANPNK